MKNSFKELAQKIVVTTLVLTFITTTPVQSQVTQSEAELLHRSIKGQAQDFYAFIKQGWKIWTARDLSQDNLARFGPKASSYQLTKHQQEITEVIEEKLRQAHEAYKQRKSTAASTNQELETAPKELLPQEMIAALKELNSIWQWFASDVLERGQMRIVLPQGPKITHTLQTLLSIIQFTKYQSAAKSNLAIAESSATSNATQDRFPTIRDYAVELVGVLGSAQGYMRYMLSQLNESGYLGNHLELINPDGNIDLVKTKQALIDLTEFNNLVMVNMEAVELARKLLEQWSIVEELTLMEVVNHRLLNKDGISQRVDINPGSGSPYARGLSMGARLRTALHGTQPSEAAKSVLRTGGYVSENQFLLNAIEMRVNVVGALIFVGVIFLANATHAGYGFKTLEWLPKEESWDKFINIFNSWKHTLIFAGGLLGFNWVGHALIYGKNIGVVGKSTLLKGLMLDARAMYGDWAIKGLINQASKSAAGRTASTAMTVAAAQAQKGLSEAEFLKGFLNPPSKMRTAKAIAGVTLRSGLTLSGAMVAIDTISMILMHPYLNSIKTLTQMGFHAEARVVMQRLCETTFLNSLFLGSVAIKAASFTIANVMLDLIASKFFLTRLGYVPAGVHLVILQIVFTVVSYLLHKTLTPILKNKQYRDIIEQKKSDYLKITQTFTDVVSLMDKLDEVIVELGIAEIFSKDNAEIEKLQMLHAIFEGRLDADLAGRSIISKLEVGLEIMGSTDQTLNNYTSGESTLEETNAAVVEGMQTFNEKVIEAQPQVIKDPAGLNDFKLLTAIHMELNRLWSMGDYDGYKSKREEFEEKFPHMLIRSREPIEVDKSLVKLPKTNSFLEWLTNYQVSAAMVSLAYGQYRNHLGLAKLAPIEVQYLLDSKLIEARSKDLAEKFDYQIFGEDEEDLELTYQRLAKLIQVLFIATDPKECDYLKSYPEAVMVLSNYKVTNDVEGVCRTNGALAKSDNPIFTEIIATSEAYRLMSEKPQGWQESLFDQYGIIGSPIAELCTQLWFVLADFHDSRKQEELTKVNDRYWDEARAAAAEIAALGDFEQEHTRAGMIRFDIQVFDAEKPYQAMCGHERCQTIEQRLESIANDIGLNPGHHLSFGKADPNTTWSSLFTSEMAFWQDAWMDYPRDTQAMFGVGEVDTNYWMAYDQRQRLYDVYIESVRKTYLVRSLKERGLAALNAFTHFDRDEHEFLLFLLFHMSSVDPAELSPMLAERRKLLKESEESARFNLDTPEEAKKAMLEKQAEEDRNSFMIDWQALGLEDPALQDEELPAEDLSTSEPREDEEWQ